MLFETEKKFLLDIFSTTLIHLSNRFTSASKPAAYRSLLTVVSATSATSWALSATFERL
jgi:hypothetical protein